MTVFEVNGRRYEHDGTPVVVICIDGSEPDYHEQAVQGGHMPWLARLLATDAVSWPAQCAMPALTNPNNVSIATGRPPSVHGISGNHFLDPATGEDVAMTDPSFLRAPTIFAAAQASGLDVTVITAKDKLRRLLGAGLPAANCFSAESADEDTCHLVGLDRPEVYSARLSEFVLATGVRLLQSSGVDLMYLSLSDYVQHKYAPGTDEANSFYAMIDGYAAQLDALGAVVVMTADHGMSAKSHADGTPRVIFLEDVLDPLVAGARVVLPITDPYTAHHGALGSSAYVYLPRGADSDAVTRHLRELAGIDATFRRQDAARELHLPEDRIGDVVVIADTDTALGRRADLHDLTGLDRPLRSHGGFGEQAVPFIVNRPLDPNGPIHNYDAFMVATTITSRAGDGFSSRANVARPAADAARRPVRTQRSTPRRPGIRGVQVWSLPSAGVVQWQNISFPS